MSLPDNIRRIESQFSNDGFVVVSPFFDDAEINTLSANLQRYIDEVVPTVPTMDAFFDDVDSRKMIRMLPRMDQHDEYFRQLLEEGCLPDLAKRLCGANVVPHDAAYFNKLPIVGDVTPPHQDGYYFHLDPCKALTIWLALDAVDEENGCLYYVRGSHRGEMRIHGRTEVLGFSQGIVDYGREDDLRNEVAACVMPGDLIIHDAMAIHRADANRSARTRRALGFVYFSEESKIDQARRDQYQKNLASDWRAKGKI
ncbi:MAG: phytanoyl-CoA dioxygenase family protein [Planctomycetaceae bacterium]|nr:phytanoyl-CoA dioxygenase family protein [Planctomycetaceae bacterium]